jgi:hypothetical protein
MNERSLLQDSATLRTSIESNKTEGRIKQSNQFGRVPNPVCGLSWIVGLRRYLFFVVLANLVWELSHLPLYTIWAQANLTASVFAALHCTAGDLLISTASLLGALLLVGHRNWPMERYWPPAILAILFGVAYTIYSELLNTQLRNAWAYSELMPTIPWLGVGLSPLAQWMVIPTANFLWLRRTTTSSTGEPK